MGLVSFNFCPFEAMQHFYCKQETTGEVLYLYITLGVIMYEKPSLRVITENVVKVITSLRPEMLPYSQDQLLMHIHVHGNLPLAFYNTSFDLYKEERSKVRSFPAN